MTDCLNIKVDCNIRVDCKGYKRRLAELIKLGFRTMICHNMRALLAL